MFLFPLVLFVACVSNNSDKKNDVGFCNSAEINIKISKEDSEMKTKTIYPDSLTPLQRSCVEKAFRYANDPIYESWEVCPLDVDDLMTKKEMDALIELIVWNYKKKYNRIEDEVFSKRFTEVFGYDFDTYVQVSGNRYTDNLIAISTEDPEIEFYVSKKENIIIHCQCSYLHFTKSDDIRTFCPLSKTDGITIGECPNYSSVSYFDYLFHLNNYVFNNAGASRTWLLLNDKYFMSHLLLDYGYDDDKDINKMVLKKNRENDKQIIDMPLATFHVYPNGKFKILDNLLTTAAELSTADSSDYFNWATSVIDSFNVYRLRSEEEEEMKPATEEEYQRLQYIQRIKNLSIQQRRELIAHIVNYMHPVYEEFIESNSNYGNQNFDFGDLRIMECFWSAIIGDHGLIDEIEKNDYYGLPNLESLINKMHEFEPFYNEETKAFEPWYYVPLRYQ